MALTKITGNVIEAGAVTSASINTASIATAIANDGLVANSSGIFVNANSGLSSNSSGTFVVGGTGVTSNATGIHIGQDVSTTSDVTFGNVSSSAMSVGSHAITANTTHLLLGSVKLDAVDTAIANLVASAPGTLDTLNEIATALGSDPDLANTLTTSIATKAPSADPTFTGNATFDSTTLFVDGTNNRVGVGLISPNYPLEVAGASTVSIAYQRTGVSAKKWGFHSDNDATYWQNITDSTLPLTIKNGGNVGIGTVNPNQKLEIEDASTPKIRFQRTGSYWWEIGHTSSDFQFESQTGGVIMHMNFDGNVGIGTNNPQAKLHVVHPVSEYTTSLSETTTKSTLQLKTHAGDSTITTFGGVSGGHAYIQRSNGTGTTSYGLLLNPYGGKVGIGTTDPSNALSVVGVITSGNFTSVGAGGTPADLNTAEVGPGYINLARDDTASVRQLTFAKNGAVHSYFETTTSGLNIGGTNVGIGTDSPTGVLHVVADGNHIHLERSAHDKIAFGTGTANGLKGLHITNVTDSIVPVSLHENAPAASLVLNSSGNVGIGTNNPQGRLSISGPNTGSLPVVDITATGTGTFQRGVRMLNSGMNSGDHIMYALGRSDNNSNMGQTYFYFDGAGSSLNRISMGLHSVDDVFNITANGNIGIANTNPQALLHLHGETNNWAPSPTILFTSTGTNGNVRNWRIGPADTNYGNFHIAKSDVIGGIPDSTAEASTFTIDYQGNVGIGTVAPDKKLTISANSNPAIKLNDEDSSKYWYKQLESDGVVRTYMNTVLIKEEFPNGEVITRSAENFNLGGWDWRNSILLAGNTMDGYSYPTSNYSPSDPIGPYIDGYKTWYPDVNIRFNQNAIYSCSLTVFQVNDGGGVGYFYGGFICKDKNFNTLQVDGIGTYQYIMGSSQVHTSGNRYTYTVTVQGTAGSGVVDYSKVDAGTVWLAPMMLINYPTSNGQRTVIENFTVSARGV